MKRARELEEVVGEIVSTGKAKDEEGKPLYPVMQEPLVMALFGAPDALYEVITERPIMLLNMIQTNKALEAFFSRFEGIWIRMIDVLVEKEMGVYASEIYPFFVVEKHRKYKPETLRADFIGWPKETFAVDYLAGSFPPSNLVFYVVYFDTLTALYMRLFTVAESVIILFRANWEPTLLRVYLDQDHTESHFVASFTDCFLIGEAPDHEPVFTSKYDVGAMRVGLKRIEKLVMEELEDHFLSIKKRERIVETQELITKLTALLDMGTVPDVPVLIKLDKAIATPYRTLLFDSVQGLCKTPQAQKEFLFDILRQFSTSYGGKERMIKDYGQSLNCALCRSETHSVDTLLMHAFCTEACRSQYLGHSLK